MGIQSPPLKLSNPPQSSHHMVEETAYLCILSAGPTTYHIDYSQKEMLFETCTEPELKKILVDGVLYAVILELFYMDGRGLKTVKAECHRLFDKLKYFFSRSSRSCCGIPYMLII